ncbi:voltage-gated chloride channel [Spirochaetia bacterium]|nr:voltage-gated chloride channel [Spirochaetia bacterium]
MRISRGKNGKLIWHWYNSRLAIVLESILIGFITGFVIVLLRVALSRGDNFRLWLYGVLPKMPWYWTGLWILGLIAVGLFLGFTAKKWPMIRGSGIPQVKGALKRQMTMRWLPELPLKIITGILGLGAGLSMGREGPSIQIGAYVGRGVVSLFHRPHKERQYLISAASAAGLAAAFNAPLAGVLFVQEELQSGSMPILVACSMGASMAADAVTSIFFGLGPIFDFKYIDVLPLRDFPWIIVLGIICGLFGDLFKRSLYLSQDLYKRLKIPEIALPVLPLLLSVPLGFFLFDITGGGHSLIESLPVVNRSLAMICVLFAGKFIFTALCYGSGTAGGIFLPVLACGALAGTALGQILETAGWAADGQGLNFLILGMAAFFTAVVKAPVTGIVLILEMSGNLNHLSGLVLVSLSAYLTTELIASPPVYVVLLDRMLAGKKKQHDSEP